MNIHIFYRKKGNDRFSIEKVYDTLIPFLKEYNITKLEVPYRSIGIVKRIGNILYSAFHQGGLNHITGDVNYIILCMKKNTSILTIHDIYPLYRTKGFRKELLKFFWFSLPIKKSSKIVTVSNFSKNEIVSNFDVNPNKIKVIYNCISSQFTLNKKPFNSKTPNILHLGTKKNKNIDNLIEATKQLNIQLIIVGVLNPEQVNKLKKYGTSYENVNNVSEIELIELYRKCDIVSFISTYEGFGLPIIESQATGRVVITSNIAPMDEVAGEGALFVNPFSIEDIKKGILELISNEQLRADLILKGIENIKRFESQQIALQYSNLYKEISNAKEA